jgi:two-component sensor histidine kinase
MSRFIPLVLLFFSLLPGAVAQSGRSAPELSPAQAAALAKTWQNRALWFRDMPQFDRDSTVIYFDKAVALLEAHPPLRNEQLARLFLDITDRRNRSHPFLVIDSLANVGWKYYQAIPDRNKDKLLEYGLLSNWATIKVEKGEFEEAVALFTQALSLIQDDDRPVVRAKFLVDKARFIKRYGLPDEKATVLKNIEKSMALYRQLDLPENNSQLFSIYQLLVMYYDPARLDSTNYYLDQMKALLPTTKNPFQHAWYYSVRGDVLIHQKKYPEAKAHLLKGKQILEIYKMQNVDSYAYTISVLAGLAMAQGNYGQAIENYKKEREVALINNFKQQSINVLRLLSIAYEKNGDYAQALAFERQFTKEELAFEEERSERSLRENELEINVLKQEKELDKKREQQYLFVAALLIGLVLLGLVYRNYRLKQRANQKLESLNGELATKNTLLDKRNAENELLLKEIHHRVKNNLEVVSSLLELQSAQIDDPSVQAAMLSSQNRVHSMGIIHQKLYQGEHLAAIEMRDYFVNLSQNILDSFQADGRVKIECNMPELVLDVDTAISIGLITNELLTNSLKYAFEGRETGAIRLSLNEEDGDGLRLNVQDDGIGKSSTEPTKGTGFGTQLINLLTRQLDGTLTYDTSHGTSVSLFFRKTTPA